MLEDSVVDAEIVRQSLLKAKPNCVFKLVMTAEEYIEALDQFEPDLILSDNTLPQFNATEALDIFNQRSLHIPFILVTGTVSEEFAANIIKLGADDYILKDRLARLPSAIDAALKQRRAENEKLEAQKELTQSERKYRLLFERNLAGVYQSSIDGRILSCNDAFAHILGYTSHTEIEQKNAYMFYFSAGARDEFIERLHKERHLTNYEAILKHRDGREIFIIENISLYTDTKSGESIIEGVIIDISEWKIAEDRIRFNANLLNAVGQAVIATDVNGIVIYWNSAAEKIYGWSAAESMGKNIVDLTPTDQTKEAAIEIMKELQKGNFWSGEFLVNRKDGSSFPAYVTDSPIYDQQGRLSGIIGVSVDISERKKSEETLKLMEREILNQKIQEQKKISRAIIKAQEEEKNHIGQELHDNINQILAGTKIYLSIAAKKNEAIKELVKYPIELIDSSIEEIRLLSRKQVTPLKNINLEELVRQLLSNLDQSTITKTGFSFFAANESLSDDLKLNIYRIIQEQINNILKHADAKNVNILIKLQGKAISIVVTDDGKGFNPNAKRKGIGISNMINRIESYNGKVKIKSSPGAGCKIAVKIPC